ncbi:MAG: hypothetical protein B7Y02_00340 [Rhodobacterales bacterium 17-64-5]|nr:MAG: hypothetical protein B7Y02_00340 [Rhodobacterales bacterium 17-64-5]
MVLVTSRDVFHGSSRGCGHADRVDFAPRVRLEFLGTQLRSDGGLLVMFELDDTLGLLHNKTVDPPGSIVKRLSLRQSPAPSSVMTNVFN